MGGQVIYLPKNPSFGEALGSGVSQGMSSFVTREMDLQQKQRLHAANMAGLNAINAAGSREKALEIMASGNIPFQNAEEMNGAMRYIDAKYPPKDTTVHSVDTYDPQGNTVKKYVQAGQLPQLNDPIKAQEILGPDVSMRKPDPKVSFYTASEDGSMKAGRMGTLGTRQDGEYTIEEINQIHKNKSEKLAAESAARSAKAAEAANTREGRNAETQSIQTTMAMARNAQSSLANALNLKHSIGIDGLLSIDPENNAEKAKVYNKAQPLLLDYMRKHKGDTGKAVSEILDKLDYTAPEESPPAPIAAPKKEGITDKIRGLFGASDAPVKEPAKAAEKPAAKKEAAVEDAPRDPSKRKAGKSYKTDKGVYVWTGTGWVNP